MRTKSELLKKIDFEVCGLLGLTHTKDSWLLWRVIVIVLTVDGVVRIAVAAVQL